jgi:restriction endonuclease
VAPFAKGNLIYISTKNMTFLHRLAQKLALKYTSLYKILQDFNNHLFRIELPDSLRSRGVHNVFHALLFQIYKPNNDWLFSERLDFQITIQSDDIMKAVDSQSNPVL